MSDNVNRLVRLLQHQGILSESEARAAIRDYRLARDGSWPDGARWGGGEAVVHYGGPRLLIEDAVRNRRMWRRLYGAYRVLDPSRSVSILGVTLRLEDDDPATLETAIHEHLGLYVIECPDEWYHDDGVVAYLRDGACMVGVYPDGSLTDPVDVPVLARPVLRDCAGVLHLWGGVVAWEDVEGDLIDLTVESIEVQAATSGWDPYTHLVRVVREDAPEAYYLVTERVPDRGWVCVGEWGDYLHGYQDGTLWARAGKAAEWVRRDYATDSIPEDSWLDAWYAATGAEWRAAR